MSCSDSRASTRHEGLCRGQAVADSSWLLDELGFPTSHGIGDPALAIVETLEIISLICLCLLILRGIDHSFMPYS